MMTAYWTNWTTEGTYWTAQTPVSPYFSLPGPIGPDGPIGFSVWENGLSESEPERLGNGAEKKRYRGISIRTNWTVWTILVFQWLTTVLHWTARRDHLDQPSESAGPSRRGHVGGTLSRDVSVWEVK